MNKRIQVDNWYNFPQYYDLVTADETIDQLEFILGAIQRYGVRPSETVFEPGCGSGRLVRELAARGKNVYAFDTNQQALRYLRSNLARRNLTAHIFSADMKQFEIPAKADLGYCFMNTFRHLLTEQEARGHLLCASSALRPGGLYFLGLHVMPPDALDECTERWNARSGSTSVSVTLRVLSTDRRKRLEQIRISLLVKRRSGELRIRSDFPLRRYSLKQIQSLLDSVPQFEILETYDFGYDFDQPIKLTPDVSDVVFVLRKQKSF